METLVSHRSLTGLDDEMGTHTQVGITGSYRRVMVQKKTHISDFESLRF